MVIRAVSSLIRTLLLVGTISSVLPACGQQAVADPAAEALSTGLPLFRREIPRMAPRVEPSPETPQAHPFWDHRNILLFSGIGVFRALDFASTKNMLARGREEILLTNEVVKNNPAFTTIEIAGTATSIALSYWLHRSGHHKLERWLSIGHIGVTGFGVARNYSLKTKH